MCYGLGFTAVWLSVSKLPCRIVCPVYTYTLGIGAAEIVVLLLPLLLIQSDGHMHTEESDVVQESGRVC